jgi:hypothetical protein
MVLNGQINLNGPGGTFKSAMQDVVRFTPSSLGENTAGGWDLYFDGSDVGLSTTSEKIDALGLKSDGTLLISTYGKAVVSNGGTNITGQDEDLLGIRPTSTGANTAGTWSLVFDGSTVSGLESEDVTAAWYDDASGLYFLTVVDDFAAGGASGTNRTVFSATPGGGATVFWDAAAAGFPGPVDALHVALAP